MHAGVQAVLGRTRVREYARDQWHHPATVAHQCGSKDISRNNKLPNRLDFHHHGLPCIGFKICNVYVYSLQVS